MNPKLVLSLWRERWGKAAEAARGRPYLQGKLNQWGRELTNASAWSLSGVTACALAGCTLIYIMLMTAQFSLGGQVAFSILFVSTALYARRYAGTWVTLALCGLFATVSMRYLYWRLTTTLGPEFSLDFTLGLGLWVAELYLWLLISLRIVRSVWPLTQAQVSLPEDSAIWPTVDVFILGQGQTDAAIRQATLAALAIHWPKTKIKAYILDTVPRDSLQKIAASLSVDYLVSDDPAAGQAALINRAMTETKGELILILEGAQAPDRSFLQSTVGWFVRDKRLGMLQTPHHFLAPAPSAHSLALCQSPALPGGAACAVLRRTMLVAAGGIESRLVTVQTHTALTLQNHGYIHGYIGCGGLAVEGTAQDLGLAPAPAEPGPGRDAPSATALFRVDDPFLGRALHWKQYLAGLQSMLQFYYAAPRLIFLTAPLAYLLAGVQLIQTTPELLGAYALPYLLLAHFTMARLQGVNRLPIWADTREVVLAWYLLIPTTLTFVRTALRKGRGILQGHSPASINRLIAWPYGLIALVNLVGLGAGIARLPFLHDQTLKIAALYLLWCACNLMLLAALLAVAEETRHIRQQTRLLLQMPAMVQLPSGHTIACMTQNFPQTNLSLQLPVALAVETGSMINLSIFRGHREFTFPARVAAQHNSVLQVSVEDTTQNNYQLFGAATLSRGPDWPQWLPGRDADHPLPSWLDGPFIVSRAKVLVKVWIFDKFVKWRRQGNWIGK